MIVFTHTPPEFTPVYTDGLFFTVSADTNHFKFRYVYNIYVDGVLQFEGKATPNPFGLGIIDVSRILKTYVRNNPISYWNTTPIYTHQTFPFSRPSQDETINYQLNVGYEYASSEIAQVTGFTGSGTTIGPPTQTVGVYKTFHSTMGVNGRANQQDFDIDPFVLSGTPQNINPTTSGLFLTNSPRTRDIQPDEYYTLAFTNYYLTKTTLSEPYYVQYKFYDDNGTLIDTKNYNNITTNGGGPLPNCTYVYPAWYLMEPKDNTTYNTLYVGAGPMNLEPILPPNAVQYTVQLFGKFTGTTSPVQPTPTPTPTPRPPEPIPCSGSCADYTVSNPSLGTCSFTYFSCSQQRNITIQLPGQTSTIVRCVCGSSMVYECDLDVDFISNCQTPPNTCSTCFQVSVTNDSDRGPSTFYYFDCEADSWSAKTLPSQTGFLLNCACNTFYAADINDFTFTITAICGETPPTTPTPTPTPGTTQSPTPTPTRTPTPTATCPGYKVWNIVTGNTSCSGGICTLGSPVFSTVYTDCSVSDITSPSTIIYVTSGLSGVFSGFFEQTGIIYQSDTFGVTFECTTGDGC